MCSRLPYSISTYTIIDLPVQEHITSSVACIGSQREQRGQAISLPRYDVVAQYVISENFLFPKPKAAVVQYPHPNSIFYLRQLGTDKHFPMRIVYALYMPYHQITREHRLFIWL